MITPAYIRTMAEYNAEMNRGCIGRRRGFQMPSGGSRVARFGDRSTAPSTICCGATSNGCRALTIGQSRMSRSSRAPD